MKLRGQKTNKSDQLWDNFKQTIVSVIEVSKKGERETVNTYF